MAAVRKIRVLSVDDHAFLAEGLRARLALEPDMEVVGHLPRAERLAAKVREVEADIVLLDIEMPGPDPFEALTHLRQECPNVRAIILSAYVRDRYVDATIKAGAWGYLAKSDEPESIVSAIRDVAEGRFTFGPLVMQRCRQLGKGEAGGLRPRNGGPAPDATGGDDGEDQGSPTREPGEEAPVNAGGAELEGVGVPRVAPESRLSALTTRELQILRMIGKGMSRTEIAKVIFRSPKTVDAHRSSIMEKLAIHDRVELARYAIREGLVEL